MRPSKPSVAHSVTARRLSYAATFFFAAMLSMLFGCKKENNSPESVASQPKSDATLKVRGTAASHYERREGKDRVVVFVHGVYGDAAETWKCAATGLTWPQLLLKDPTFSNTDVYVTQYPTSKIGNLMSIDDQVASLMNRLEADEVFSGHREVVFVAHSMGGLVVQRMLLTHHDLAPKVKYIYFLSTPQEGAAIARLGHVFNGDPNLLQMIPGDENTYLRNMEAEWIGAKFGIPRYCAIERKPTNGVLVVSELSGTRNCAKVVPLDEDHLGVAKPCSMNDDAYVALVVAERENPIMKTEVVTRTWTQYEAVSCGDKNEAFLTASIPLDPKFSESVIEMPTGRYINIDHVPKYWGPTLGTWDGNTVRVAYSFVGEDKGLGCHGGHLTIVVDFKVQRISPA